MKTILGSACGVAIGTLLYTFAFGSDHRPDWIRAIVVGIVCGLLAIIWARRKKFRSSAPDLPPAP